MSAVKAAFDDALNHLHQAAAKLEAIGHNGWERVKEIARELEGDAPKLAGEAASDGGQVVATAEHQGVTAAENQAEGDAVQLAQDAVHDVADALAGSAKPQPEAAHSPAQTTAVIEGEAAATEQHN